MGFVGKNPQKVEDLLNVIARHLEAGRFLDTRHATDRQSERKITRSEVLFVLRHGFHEKRKDRFDEQFHAWNYAVRGKTMDRKDLRIIVSFDEAGMLIITAIEMET